MHLSLLAQNITTVIAFKNALDYVGKEWSGKPAAFIGYGSTNGSRSTY